MNVKHGARRGGMRPPEYEIWCGIIQRCENPNQPAYPKYGGRGIRICDRWRHDFAAFLADVGLRPAPHYSIDRINNAGHYEPSNVRWATPTDQARNRIRTRFLEIDGGRKPITEWCAEYDVPLTRVVRRLRLGWPPKAALLERVGATLRKAACHQGHAFDKENTYVDPSGERHCRACRTATDRRRRPRRSGEVTC